MLTKLRIFLCLICLHAHCSLAQKDTNFSGNRSVIVHLFEWKWVDIAEECERFLQYKNFGGIQISPPSENVVVKGRPWWERYQPVSYNLTTRSGSELELADMIKRCNEVGVRIYADVVFNHMAGLTGTGTGGNKALSDLKMYPALPFGPEDFHSTCNVTNYLDPEMVRNCQINNYRDLDQSVQFVQGKIIEYLNHLIELGIAGFRIDSAKYMWPTDLEEIYSKLNNLNEDFGFSSESRPFIYQDVPTFDNDVVGNEEYISLGVVIEYKYSTTISRVFSGRSNLSKLVKWGSEWGFIPEGDDALVFVDNPSNQRKEGVLTYKTLKPYKMALAFMLAHDYGIPRILSSYFFDTKDIGPPQDTSGNIKSPAVYSDGSCGNGYVCEHRWPLLVNMVEFRTVVDGTAIENWWSNEEQQIAFSRGNKGFIVFNNGGNITEDIPTSLSSGSYCDVISGYLVDGSCTGKSVVINATGYASFTLLEGDFNGVLAIHINSKL